MSSEAWINRVEKVAANVCEKEGCILYDIEFIGAGKGRALRVFIDKETGVGIEDCSNVSKGLNEVLDAEDIIPGGAYDLEVSTPGIDRHLKQPWHFEKVVGKKIWVRTQQAFESLGVTDKKWLSAKQVEAELTGTDETGIHFKIKDVEIKIPYSAIDKAKVVFEIQKGKKK